MKNDDHDLAQPELTLDNSQTEAVPPPVEDEVAPSNVVAVKAAVSHAMPPVATFSNEVARPAPQLEDEAHHKPLE